MRPRCRWLGFVMFRPICYGYGYGYDNGYGDGNGNGIGYGNGIDYGYVCGYGYGYGTVGYLRMLNKRRVVVMQG